MTVYSTDTFNRADSTTVLGSTDGAGALDPLTWVQSIGTWGILTNRAYASAVPSVFGLAIVNLGTANVDVSVTVAVLPASTNTAGVAFRVTNSSNFWRLTVNGSGVISLLKQVSGSALNPASGALGTTGGAAGDVLRVVANGDSLACYRNGTLIGTATDSFNNTVQTHGLSINSGTAARLDSWSASSVLLEQALSVTQVQTPTMARVLSAKTLTVTQVQTPTLGAVKAFVRTLSVTQIQTPTMSRVLSALLHSVDLSVTQIQTPSMSRAAAAPPPPPPVADESNCPTLVIGLFTADGLTPDANGIVYTVDQIGGWWDSLPMRTATLEAQPRGETITVARENGRQLDVQIVAHAPGGQIELGAPACFAAIETIKAAFRSVFIPAAMQVIDPYESRSALVRRVGPIKQQIVGNAGLVRFSIPMLAENPLTAVAAGSFTDLFVDMPIGVPLSEGVTEGNWITVFNGGGSVTPGFDGIPILTLIPAVATAPGLTHAALVKSVPSFGNIDLTLSMRTTAQLRTGSAPNAWEMAWALWHYTDNTHFYYLILKPNGWELGKADPAYPGAQRFLATGVTPTYSVGTWYDVHVIQFGNGITIEVDGAPLAMFTDNERPYLSGRIALYTEDAAVDFGSVLA